MSSGVGGRAEVAALRVLAHPVRLQILSLLTGSAMSAAEVARELDLTHANSSYHLRLLVAAGQLVEAGEESIRGGRAKRFRYDVERPAEPAPDAATAARYYQAMAAELLRRSTRRREVGGRGTGSDAELWVDPDTWSSVVDQISIAIRDLHRAAVPIRTSDAVHVSVTTALFEMGESVRQGDTA